MTVGDCFAGIGGFSLGFQRAGFEIKWQIEIDPFCQRVLEKHWPDVQRFGDIREVTAPPKVDVVCGGFPCQDISSAGTGKGLSGDKSGLWWEMLRLVRLVRPQYVAVENVSALTHRGLDLVLGSLAELGYDAEWETLSACMFGAPHMRRRMFVVAYPNDPTRITTPRIHDNGQQRDDAPRSSLDRKIRRESPWETVRSPEPLVSRMADGVRDRVDRNTALGNAVVPAVAEYVARCVMEHANTTSKNTPKNTKSLE